MDPCLVCGGVEFYTESGYYFCQECQTQQPDKREDIVEYADDTTTQKVRRKIKKVKSRQNDDDKPLGWTSWEAYNFILLGWTNELIMLGASPDFKITVLQLWAMYLRKLEAAFTSFRSQNIPKLPIKYRQKDAEIIYGKKEDKPLKKATRKRKLSTNTSDSDMESTHASDISIGRLVAAQRKHLIDAEYQKYLDTSESETELGSSIAPSLHSLKSDTAQSNKKKGIAIKINKFGRERRMKINEYAKKKISYGKITKYKENCPVNRTQSAEFLTTKSLLALLNLALRINDEDIHLSDMIRFLAEGHMSCRKLEHFFPDDEPLPSDIKPDTTSRDYKSLNYTSLSLSRILEVRQMPEPNLIKLIERYCTEFQLPHGIVLYAERMIALNQPKLTFSSWSTSLPRYEARAVSIIMLILKILFGLDGVTEYEISTIVGKINK